MGTQVQFIQAKDIETIQTKNKYFLQNYAFYFSFSRPTDNFEDVSPQKYKHPKMEKHEHYHNVSVLIYELYKYIVSPKRFSCNLKKMCAAKIVYVLKRKTGEWGSCHSKRKHNGLFTQRSLRPERPGGLLEARQPLRTYPVSTPGPPGSQPLLL